MPKKEQIKETIDYQISKLGNNLKEKSAMKGNDVKGNIDNLPDLFDPANLPTFFFKLVNRYSSFST